MGLERVSREKLLRAGRLAAGLDSTRTYSVPHGFGRGPAAGWPTATLSSTDGIGYRFAPPLDPSPGRAYI